MRSKRLKNALKTLGKCTQNARKTPPQNREKRPQELLLQFDTRSRNIFSHTERIIKSDIVAYLDANGLINNIQHGFRSGRSTVSALLEHYSSIVDALEAGEMYDTILGPAIDKDCLYVGFIRVGVIWQNLSQDENSESRASPGGYL